MQPETHASDHDDHECLDEDALARFVEGEADDALRARIARHVDGCPSCFELLAELGRHGDSRTVEEPDPPAMSRLMRDVAFLAPSKELDRFVLLEAIGRGGMGTVFAAYDRKLDRKVAMKLLHAHTLVDPDARAQLLREARALGKISHPNVVPVHEVGELGERLYVVMEHIQGQTLRAWARARARSWKEIVDVFVQAGMGLIAAHDAGVVHRDFKPENVLIGDDGRVRVVDFGLARASASRAPAPTAPVLGSVQSTETWQEHRSATGIIAGTPAYMAPEQWRGDALDGRTDQFAWCVALYEALYGERPFVADTREALEEIVRAGRMQPPPKGPRVPARLRRVLLRGLSTAPEQRWPSMDALLTELRRLVAPRRGLALVLALGLGGVGVVVGQSLDAGQRCEGARAQLDGIWDEPRKLAVKAAILATELPYAPDTWARVDRVLDDYADEWAAKHTDVCEATSVRGDQSTAVMDLRMGCLQHRRVALREAVGVLAETDATEAQQEKVENAVSLVSSLPGLSRCDDVEALRAELPPPEDPEVAARVQAERERLARAGALHEAGDYAKGLAVANEAMATAEALAYPPLLAEALVRRSVLLEATGDYETAEQDLERAYLLALEHGHHALAAEATASLAYLVGTHRAQPERGLWWGETALAWSREASQDPLLEAKALTAIGGVRRSEGKLEPAIASLRAALEIETTILGPQHDAVAMTLTNLGVLLKEHGELEAALSHARRALALREALLGPHHPRVGMSLNTVATVLHDQGHLEEALAQYRRGLAIWEETLGPSHPYVAGALTNMAVVLIAQGHLEEALAQHERALAIFEQALGPAHPNVAVTLMNVGTVLENLGRLDEAQQRQERALAIREQALGPRHPDVAVSLNNLGKLQRAQGKPDEALARYRLALSILEESRGPQHPSLAFPLNNMGAVLRDQGKLDEAREHLERALTIREQAQGPEHQDVAYPLLGLARVALASGEVDVARRHAEAALAIREAREVSATELAETRFVLAQALWPDHAQRMRAGPLAQQARDAYAEAGERHVDARAEVDAWLASHAPPAG